MFGINIYLKVMSPSTIISSEVYGQLSITQLTAAFSGLTVTGGTDVIADALIDMGSVAIYAINTLMPIFTTTQVSAETSDKFIQLLLVELQKQYSGKFNTCTTILVMIYCNSI